MPAGASSKTMHWLGSISSNSAAFRNVSGAGLPLATSSPHTMGPTQPRRSAWPAILRLKLFLGVLVATATGMLCLARWCSNLSAPGSARTLPHLQPTVSYISKQNKLDLI